MLHSYLSLHVAIFQQFSTIFFIKTVSCTIFLHLYLLVTNFKNSSRVFWSSRNTPSIVDVTVLLLIFWTPRITMHIWLASTITATPGNSFFFCENIIFKGYSTRKTKYKPAGWTACVTATAICLVNLSWTWRRLEYISTILQK